MKYGSQDIFMHRKKMQHWYWNQNQEGLDLGHFLSRDGDPHHVRNGPARKRRRERCAEACQKASEEDAIYDSKTIEQVESTEQPNVAENATKNAKTEEVASKVGKKP